MSVSKMVLVVSMLCVFVTAASAQTLRVNADRTTLRDKPSTDGAAVASLVKGDELTSIEKAGPSLPGSGGRAQAARMVSRGSCTEAEGDRPEGAPTL